MRYLKYVKVSEKKLGRVENWFQKYGDKAVLFGRMIPVFREMISIPAGFLKMKLVKASGGSKREAQKEAAKKILDLIGAQ